MRKILIILYTFNTLYTLSTLHAQIQFQRTIGGTGDDVALSIIQTTDGGYAVTGGTNSFGAGNYDFYVVKLDGSGTLQWSKTIGGTGNEYAHSIIQTTDGGYAMCGYTQSFGAGTDAYIVKLDASGTLQWSKTVGGTNYDIAYSIIQTTDGGYAVAGSTASFGAGGYDMYIVKLDASGTHQWSRVIGGPNNDYAYFIIRTTGGGYVVAGGTNSFGAGNYDFYIVTLDASGILLWSRTVGGTFSDEAYTIIQTTDGGYAVAGSTASFGAGLSDFYIVKLDANASLQWSKAIGGTGGDGAYSIVQTTDGGYAVAGYTPSFGTGNNDFYIAKLDASGTLQWSRTVGGTNTDYAYSIIRATDGSYAVAGYTNSFGAGNNDMYIVKLDASGNTCGNSTSPNPTITNPIPTLTFQFPTVTIPISTVSTPSPTVSSGGTVASICTQLPPAAPILYSPPNNSTGQPLSLNLVWYRVPTAVTYRVQLATDSLFNNLIVNDSTVTDSLKAVSGLVNNTLYFWRVNAKNAGGTGPWSAVWRFRTLITGIQPISSDVPKEFKLYANYPNPFNPVTRIRFDVPSNVKRQTSDVKIIIYDILGREVAAPVNEELKPGTYEVSWDAGNYPSGVYFYRISAGNFVDTKKMLIVK